MNNSIQGRFAHAPILERIERGALLALAFVLPLYEAPKNLLWIALIALWLANRRRARDFGGRWDSWDTLIVLWIVSGCCDPGPVRISTALEDLRGQSARRAGPYEGVQSMRSGTLGAKLRVGLGNENPWKGP